MDATLKSDDLKKKMKRSGSFNFKKHKKVKMTKERRLSQDSRQSTSTIDEEELERMEMEKSESSLT